VSSDQPTRNEQHADTSSPLSQWSELEGRVSGTTAAEEEDSAPPRIEPGEDEAGGEKLVFSGRARALFVGALTVLVVALAAMVVLAVVGEGPVHRPGSRSEEVQANGLKWDGRRSSRARRAERAGGSLRARRRPAGHGPPRAAHRQRGSHRPARQLPEAPSRPPAYGATTPESASGPSAPPLATPSPPDEGPRLRDGATESAEFGL